ncbi:MAG: PepSY domain-containing protein [Phycisphaeraceae bacterium]|nr:PepSY domain-containing protein [Phycisphaeraceae bacterium]
MKPHILLRRVHYWASLPIAVPLLLVIATGLLLQFKKSLPWVQPAEQRAAGEPALGLEQILEAAATVDAAAIDAWDDVYRVEYRPGRNLVKVVSNNRTEIQIDAATGAVLQVAPRRSDLIESLHDGSFFGDFAKTWLFTPAAIVLLGMLLTGVYLFFVPILAKRRRARRGRAR